MKEILCNGKIYVERGHFEQALYIEDGVIRAVGSNSAVRAAAGSGAKETDCAGRTVIPGLNDSHMHLLNIGVTLSQAKLNGAKSIDEIIEITRHFMKEHPEYCRKGVQGRGWNQDYFTDGKRLPNRHDLDKISTEVPVVLTRVCGHIAVANTKAIEMLGLGRNSPQYEGGKFGVEADGYPDGVFAESARFKIKSVIPEPTQDEYEKMFLEAMDGLPVNIRLLDPPLHEFVPKDEKGQKIMAEQMGVPVEKIRQRVASLAENNPMLGHRGCRLGITFPEITAMQTRAILSAACELKKEGKDPKPEIMVPLIGTVTEFRQQKAVILKSARKVFEEYGVKIDFEIGTMIEIPRAALTADKIASEAQYFSFGTNDLTQMTFGYSRDDIASFLPVYLEKKILKVDPFQVLDQEGVGQLVKMAVDKGRAVRPNLRTGICGEHGGEPSSVKFCARIGLDYASCSPFRVPIARLAAAQAAVEG